jgi:hypothetical protein
MRALPKKYKDYYLLDVNNYTISELRLIGEYFKVKWKAKLKNILYKEVYDYLKNSFYTSKIQKKWRNYIIQKFNSTQGPAMFNRSICNNIEDFLTTENMKEISYYFFISYLDKDGFIYGFNIISVYNLILKNNPSNPYTRNPFSKQFVSMINNRIILNRVLKQTYHSIHEEIPIHTIDHKIMSLFQKIDSLGNYTQHEWITNLDSNKLRKYILELYDIWSHRAQLANEIKYMICPPNGTPFFNIPIHTINYSHNIDKEHLKHIIYEIISRLVNSAVSQDNQSLGAYYVLTALTLVSEPAAEAMPWLYYSVI